MNILNIVLFGPPGAGKGTQSTFLIEKYQLKHLSTGDLLRAEIAEETVLGLQAKKIMDQGQLVPDAVVIGMIENRIKANPNAKGFIFDGFPRTTGQAEALDRLMAELNSAITAMLALEVPKEELTQRLLERGKTSNRPDDQNLEIIEKRIQEYNDKTAPLKTFYKNQNKLHVIDGVGSIGSISENIATAIEAL